MISLMMRSYVWGKIARSSFKWGIWRFKLQFHGVLGSNFSAKETIDDHWYSKIALRSSEMHQKSASTASFRDALRGQLSCIWYM